MIRLPWKRALLATVVTVLAVIGLLELFSLSGEWLPKLREALTQNPVPVYTSSTSTEPVQTQVTVGETGPDSDAPSSTASVGTTTEPSTQEPFTLAWISDTQLYSESYPEIFLSMTQWLAENKETKNLQALIHTGDVVNNRKSSGQWANAVEAMGKLNLPYLIAPGNHDVWTPETDYRYFSQYFGVSNDPDTVIWEQGKGQYRLIDAGGMGLLLLTLGYGTGDEGIEWANNIIQQYPERYTVLGFHSYMHNTGALTTIGKTLFEQIVAPNPNVRLVLCGHHHAAGQRISELDDDGDGVTDRTVYQLLADYQDAPKGGGGFIRLLTFEPSEEKIRVHTYSPYLDQTSFYEEPQTDTFDIPL